MLLNLDAGELFDETPELWASFDILNIACGGHAGDEESMTRVVTFCASRNIAIGAHPSYPDREGFGRRSLSLPIAGLERALAGQCTSLADIARAVGRDVTNVKPHGALYHDANRDPELAAAFVRAAISALGSEITVIGPPTGALSLAAETHDLAYAREGFADRRLTADGSLVPRGSPEALISDPAAAIAQAQALASTVDTICVHADTPNALAIARALRAAIDA